MTVPPVFETGLVIDRVFASAWLDVSVQVDCPDELVAEHAP